MALVVLHFRQWQFHRYIYLEKSSINICKMLFLIKGLVSSIELLKTQVNKSWETGTYFSPINQVNFSSTCSSLINTYLICSSSWSLLLSLCLAFKGHYVQNTFFCQNCSQPFWLFKNITAASIRLKSCSRGHLLLLMSSWYIIRRPESHIYLRDSRHSVQQMCETPSYIVLHCPMSTKQQQNVKGMSTELTWSKG